jgi:hypothetical protein
MGRLGPVIETISPNDIRHFMASEEPNKIENIIKKSFPQLDPDFIREDFKNKLGIFKLHISKSLNESSGKINIEYSQKYTLKLIPLYSDDQPTKLIAVIVDLTANS